MIPGTWTLEPGYLATLSRELARADLSKFASAPGPAGPTSKPAANGVTLIRIAGVMLAGESLIEKFIAQLFGATLTPAVTRAVRAAAVDPKAQAIALHVDSPGGDSAGVQELAAAVRAAAARKPVLAHAGSIMASAALWAASGSTKITASPASEVGSIGAYGVIYDESAAAAAAGVRVHVVSSAPPLKGAGVPGTEIVPAQLEDWQRRIDALASLFVDEVALGRRLPRGQVKAIATGAVWRAAEARRRGLVDGVATFEDAVASLRGAAAPVVAAPPPPRPRPPAPVVAAPSAYEVATARARALVEAGEAPSFSRALAEVWRRDQVNGGELWGRYEMERGR